MSAFRSMFQLRVLHSQMLRSFSRHCSLRFKSTSSEAVPIEIPPAVERPAQQGLWQSASKERVLFWVLTSAATGALAWLKSDIFWLKSDITSLREEVSKGHAELRAEMATDRAVLRAEMSANQAALRVEMAEDRAAIRAEMAQERARVDAGFAQMHVRFDQLYALLVVQYQKTEEREVKEKKKDSSVSPTPSAAGCR